MKIGIIGAGQFGTSIGNCLASKKSNTVYLFTRNLNKQDEINLHHKNSLIFPNKILNERLKATSDFSKLKENKIIFIAIPSYSIQSFLEGKKDFFSNGTIVINLAKGLMSDNSTLTNYLENELLQCDVMTMKGPTFASELVNGANSIFTLGYRNNENRDFIIEVMRDTNIYLDFSKDIFGIELLSVLKNIYAILLGYIDAKYNSSNTRFLVLTKAFNEMKLLLKELGGNEETINLSCGFGDLGLTALNDLSRNRTLGLLMGKGFYSKESNSIVLEGEKAINLITNLISEKLLRRMSLIQSIKQSFEDNSGIIDINFNKLINEDEKVVLTYGTFDLLHYGHLEILRRAKDYGTKLIVGLSSDKFNKAKDKISVHDYGKRKIFLEALDYVDLVIPEEYWEQKIKDIKDNRVDIFIMGDDWKGKFDYLSKYCEVEYLPRTKGISTTKLKNNLKTPD